LNIETAVGRKKDSYDIGVHVETQKGVVIFVVMRHFCILPDAPRACADFCDPTAVSRLNHESNKHPRSHHPKIYFNLSILGKRNLEGVCSLMLELWY